MKALSKKDFLESVLLLTLGLPTYTDKVRMDLYNKIITQSLKYFNDDYLKLAPSEFLQTLTDVNQQTLEESVTQLAEAKGVTEDSELEKLTKVTIASGAIKKLTNGNVSVSISELEALYTGI